MIKSPRKLSVFDGRALRDVVIGRDSAAAIDEEGNLVQWGTGYWGDAENQKFETTLASKDLVRVGMTRSQIVALSKSGQVYVFPQSRKDQNALPKVKESGWFTSSLSKIAYTLVDSEKISSFATGDNHALLLGNSGTVYSLATGAEGNDYGQMGIVGLVPSFGKAHKVFEGASHVAVGQRHSMILDKSGHVWTFGSNSCGQLCERCSEDNLSRATPTEVDIRGMYPRHTPNKCTSIAAGGLTSYITMQRQIAPGNNRFDVWSFGSGLYGQLGNAWFLQLQSSPTKVKSISGLAEFNEEIGRTEPIEIKYLSVGQAHCLAVMNNASTASFGGHDALIWGYNQAYQLGSGKRNNQATPTFMTAFAPFKPGNDEHSRLLLPVATRMKTARGKSKIEWTLVAGHSNTMIYPKVV